MERFPSDPEQLAQNVWALALSKLINSKCGKKKSTRSERVKALRSNTEMLANLLKAVNSKVATERQRKDNSQTRVLIMSHRIFNGIADIVKNIDKLTFQQAKEVMGRSLRDDYSFIE